MQTVRTISQVVERDEAIREKPEFAVGDYMRVEYGQYEATASGSKTSATTTTAAASNISTKAGWAAGWLRTRSFSSRRREAREMADKGRIIELQRSLHLARKALERIKDGAWPECQIAEDALDEMFKLEPKQQLQGLLGHEGATHER